MDIFELTVDVGTTDDFTFELIKDLVESVYRELIYDVYEEIPYRNDLHLRTFIELKKTAADNYAALFLEKRINERKIEDCWPYKEDLMQEWVQLTQDLVEAASNDEPFDFFDDEHYIKRVEQVIDSFCFITICSENGAVLNPVQKEVW